MIQITRGELYVLRDALASVLEEEDYDLDDARVALEIVEGLLYREEIELEDTAFGHRNEA